MKNPFQQAGPVSGRHFCGRDLVLGRLVEAARSGGPVAAWGPPGMGTSSVAAAAADRLGADARAARVDLERSAGPRAAGRHVAAALRHAGIEVPSALRGDDRGPDRGTGPDEPGDAAAFVVLDGAHRLADEDGGRLREGLARGGADGRIVPLLFGRRPLDVRALLGKATARDAGTDDRDVDGSKENRSGVRLGPIPLEAWLPFALERFLESDRWIANEQVIEAVRRTGGHPRHTQHLLHELWARCGDDGRVAEGAVEASFDRLLSREGHGFRARLDALTANQRRVLAGLAGAGEGAAPFARDFLRRWELASPSSVQRALQSLSEAGWVDDRGGGPAPTDPVLAGWLRRRTDGSRRG